MEIAAFRRSLISFARGRTLCIQGRSLLFTIALLTLVSWYVWYVTSYFVLIVSCCFYSMSHVRLTRGSKSSYLLTYC